MPHIEPGIPLNGVGLARPQANAQTVKDEGSPEHASLGSRALSCVNQATPTEWALSASGKPTAEARRAGDSPRMDWSGANARPISTGNSLVSRLRGIFSLNKTSAKPISERPRFRTSYDTRPAIVERECIELKDFKSQDGSAADQAQPSNLQPTYETDLTNEETDDLRQAAALLHALATKVANCATHIDCVALLSNAQQGLDPESLAAAFKARCPSMRLAPGGDPSAKIVSLMFRQKLHTCLTKHRENKLKPKDYCAHSDATSTQRGMNILDTIEYLASLKCNHSDWLHVALLSVTQMTGEDKLTTQDKQHICTKFEHLENSMNDLLRRVISSEPNEFDSLQQHLDLFDEEAAYVGLQAMVCDIRKCLPEIELADNADSHEIIRATYTHHSQYPRPAKNKPKPFGPAANALNNLSDKIDDSDSATECRSTPRQASNHLHGLGAKALLALINTNHAN